jgi:hypothetical protein
VLVGEGTSAAYLAGALKALEEAGIRIDVLLGKGVGAVVAAFGAIQSTTKLTGPNGLLTLLTKGGVWRLRAPYRVTVFCLGAALAVFLSPALLAVLLLMVLPLIAAARIVAPETMAALFGRLQEQIATFSTQLDPIYLRAMAFPIAILFALLVVGWIIPAWFRRRRREPGSTVWSRLLGEGFVHLSPFSLALERSLWGAVRGASTEARPSHRQDIGARYRDLLSASLGQHGFSELIFYALDMDIGQEVPFVLLKDRWLTRMAARGPGGGALVAEPINLAADAGPLLFDALRAAVSPPAFAPGVPLRLPLGGRHAGEVHRFASSLLTSHSTVADAVAAGAEQIIYVSGSPASGLEGSGMLGGLTAAALRQALENDLRWAMQTGSAVFTVRPDKPRLGFFEFSGRALPGGDRLETAALAAHGERDTIRLFIRPMVGEVERQMGGAVDDSERLPGGSVPSRGKSGAEELGPSEFD